MMSSAPFRLFAVATLLLLSVVSFPTKTEALRRSAFARRNDRNFLHFEHQEVTDGPSAQWFKQPVDHFDPENTATWMQRYFVNDTLWKPNGPIFLLLGGEGPIRSTDVTGRLVLNEYAEIFNAMIISVEHRFYGESTPTSDHSTSNLRYLTSAQALSDFALFRQSYAKMHNLQNNPWVTFGGSYSGDLSAWFRFKYPQLAVGSLASSAPVKIIEHFPQYLEVVAKSVGPSCEKRIKQATTEIATMLTQLQGKNELKSIFNTCTNIITDQDEYAFWNSLIDSVALIVQYHNDNGRLPFNIDVMCELLESGPQTPRGAVLAYASFNSMINNYTKADCTEANYNDMVTQLRNTDPKSSNAAARSWTFQTCVEFGYFQTTTGASQPFPPSAINLERYHQLCKDVYGAPFVPNVDWTNTVYGSTNVIGTNVVFTNGAVDPWHYLGVLNTAAPTLPAYFMQGTAHCADLYPSGPNDPPQLTATRKEVINWIMKWIA